MLQRANESELVSLETAIERLNSNNPMWKRFDLDKIIINPIPDPDVGRVSHIKDEDLTRLSEAIKKNTTLETLTISGSGSDSTRSLEWTAEGAKAFGKAIKDHPKLSTIIIDLPTYQIKPDQIIGFLYSLTGSAKIESLTIKVYCESSPDFLNELGRLLQTRTGIKKIIIEGNIFNEIEVQEHTLDDFAKGLGNQANLNTLCLEYLNLQNEGVAQIAQSLSKTTLLKKLTLLLCQIRGAGVSSVCQLIAHNPLLEVLRLDSNPLGTEGIAELAKKLPLLNNLNFLSLNEADIATPALELILQCFLKNKLSISSLSLSSNKSINVSMDIISNLIEHNPKLKKLHLDYCGLKDYHIKKIEKLLMDPNRCKLELFSFQGNQQLNPITYSNLLDILRRNENLTDLYPPRVSDQHSAALEFNRKRKIQRKQQAFIETAITLSDVYNSKSASKEMKTNITAIPHDAIVNILSFLGANTPGMSDKAMLLCSRLILNNFCRRLDLIKKQEYKSSSDGAQKKNIRSWWSQSIYGQKLLGSKLEEKKEEPSPDRQCLTM